MICSGVCLLLLISDLLLNPRPASHPNIRAGLVSGGHVKAETAYMEYHSQHGLPVLGRLDDRRYDQCGFDFEIQGEVAKVVVEVKGLAGMNGGITFTQKEWETASDMGEDYYLALVRNVSGDPDVSIIRDPASKLNAKMRSFTTVQVGWSVGQRALQEAAIGME
jgi:carbohydrate-selective porin OprB